MSAPAANRLYFGDCLDVMREDITDESVDLIYLGPPFNSKRLYNTFIGGAQWVAFDDTWRWHEAEDDFHQVAGDVDLADTIEGLRRILGEGTHLAYLSYMANRLRECRRVLKQTGSIYLHCDPTMSHYLTIVMDGIFGHNNFQSEIVCKRTSAHSGAKRYGPVHDTILFYSISKSFNWTIHYLPYDQHHIDQLFTYVDGKGRRWRRTDLTGLGVRKGDSGQVRRHYSPTYRERHWQPPSFFYEKYTVLTGDDLAKYPLIERLDKLDDIGLVHWPRKADGVPQGKRLLKDAPGIPVQDIWTDIRPIHNQSKERLGYATQKPVGLLERIIRSSSSDGDVVLDPFCGCGTTIHAAQALNRRWVGIDICVNACKIVEERLRSHFDSLWDDVQFIEMPKTRDDAKTLADLDKFRFERWAASLVDCMEANKRQRGDGGIDGRGRLPIRKGQFIDVVSQVKGGGTSPGDVQAFNGARQQAGADLGVFTCFEERVTPRMRDAAVSAGRFMEVPTIQTYTIEDFFEGRKPEMPRAA